MQCLTCAHLQVEGSTERPRLAVFRSINHIYAQVYTGPLCELFAVICSFRTKQSIHIGSQVIDDSKSITLAAASTLTPDIRGELNGKSGGNKVCTADLFAMFSVILSFTQDYDTTLQTCIKQWS